MFIYNLKINGSKTFKIFFSCIVILFVILIGFIVYKVFSGANKTFVVNDDFSENISEIKPYNYTNILKTVHENIDDYVGTKFKFSGYVYRVLDLNDNQFILARDMIISSNYQSVVVGFLCSMDNAKQYEDNTWVTITGEITKGNYHGDMPIVKVLEIKTIDKPNEEFVYPPDDSYIPTSSLF